MKDIIIKPNISTRVYNFEKENSKSYISDEKNNVRFMLDGIVSDIWNIILTSCSYDLVYNYAKKHELEKKVNDFLLNLQSNNIIILNKNQKISSSQFTKTQDKENSTQVSDLKAQNEFDEEVTEWLTTNNLLQLLILQMNYKCNLQCAHCYNTKGKENFEISFEIAKNIIDQAFDIGIQTVGITGGECTCNKYFLEIIKYIRSRHLALVFITNSQILYDNKDLFNSVVSLFPRLIKTSLYSMDPEIHDSITRVKGSQHKTVEVIKKLKEAGIPVCINLFLTNKNKKSYTDIISFANELGIEVDISTHFVYNPNNKNSYMKLSNKELKALYKDKNFPLSIYNSQIFGSKKDNRSICRAGETVLSISPDLNVTPCNDFEYILGNLKEDSLYNIWIEKVPKFRELFKRNNLNECFTKEYCKYCLYCPTQSFYESGFLKKSSTGCENAYAYNEALKESGFL